MKNLLMIVLTVFVFSLNGNSQVKEVGVEATFEIGRNSRACKGFGLCTKKPVKIKITIKLEDKSLSRRELSDKEFKTVFTKTQNGEVRFYFDEANMQAIKDYEKSEVFILEEDYILNQKEINIKNHTIKAGEYKFLYDTALDQYYLSF